MSRVMPLRMDEDAGGVSSGADAYGVYAGSNTGDNRFQYTGEALFMEVAASGSARHG